MGVVVIDAGVASGALSDSAAFGTVLASPDRTTLRGQDISTLLNVFLNARSASSCSKDARCSSMFREKVDD